MKATMEAEQKRVAQTYELRLQEQELQLKSLEKVRVCLYTFSHILVGQTTTTAKRG